MEKKIFVMLNKVLALLMVALGYNSCGKDECEAEYGSPHADYIFRGTVTDGEGNALQGVKISSLYIFTYSDSTHVRVQKDSLSSTDENGNYSVKVYDEVGENALRFTDKDGTTFDTMFVGSPNLAPFKGGDGNWYDGVSENTMDIKLNK